MPICLPPINRRRFLAGGLAAGASALLPWRLEAKEPRSDPNFFLLASDIHIPGDHKRRYFHGSHPVQSFERAREDMFALFAAERESENGRRASSEERRPMGMIIGGDCARHDGEPRDYAEVVKLLKPFREMGMPVHLVMGNHDNRNHLLAEVPGAAASAAPETEALGKYVAIWKTKEVDWLLLDSLYKPVESPGELGRRQLKWLEKVLDARPHKPVILVAHHQLALAQYSEETRRNGLIDTEEFLKVILPRKQVKAYVFGHRHRWEHGMVEDLPWINLPSTAWVFSSGEALGFASCRLRPNGARFTFHSIDHRHAKHGEKVDLKWRV
jgi:3',5'-cyclic-AMP phosphodiesterase